MQFNNVNVYFGKDNYNLLSKIDKHEYLDAMIASHTDSSKIRILLQQALTDRIDDREIFMKGIDYSYYYEQEE